MPQPGRQANLQQSRADDFASALLKAVGDHPHSPDLTRLGRDFFEEADIPQQQFTWIGLLAGRDYLERDHIAVYLLESERSARGEIIYCEQANLVPLYTELYVALLPAIYFDMQQLKPRAEDDVASRALASLAKKLSGSEYEAQPCLIWEYDLASNS